MHGNAPAFRNIEHCQVTKALDALLVGLSDVAKQASEELGAAATEAQIVDKTIKLCLGMPCIHSERLGRMKITIYLEGERLIRAMTCIGFTRI